MSIIASILRALYRLSGVKKSFTLPENELRKEIEKQNRHRGVFTPTDHKAYYETITVNGFPCLIVRENPNPSKCAILYFFGGGMVIGPDKGDLPVMRKLLEVPVGTGILTMPLYRTMPKADIAVLDYSADMMGQAQEKAKRLHLKNVTFRQGDVGKLPYETASSLKTRLDGMCADVDMGNLKSMAWFVCRKAG